MFERYAPIQRAVKPKVWKQAIDRAIALKPTQWPTMPAPEQDENGVVNAPRSMRLWQQRHPERYDRLQRVRRVINRIAEDTRTPAEMIIKPQILRNLCCGRPGGSGRRDVPDRAGRKELASETHCTVRKWRYHVEVALRQNCKK